jgi:hypothetical protein
VICPPADQYVVKSKIPVTEHDLMIRPMHGSVHFLVSKRRVVAQLSELPLVELLLGRKWSSFHGA